ncbi:MAG: PTS sugar transporter subunit IIC [Candidatus Eremiobacteraeota bacterium]|nr:PTS sugar transporter subunit IIC [Candidatus Eremiobacteraeota bacterium]
MSPSSVAWKPLFASSKFTEALRAVGEAPGLAALRAALRTGFGAFVVAIVAFALAGAGTNVLARIAAALVPALGAMSLALVVAFSLELARRLEIPQALAVTASAAAFALGLPPQLPSQPIDFFRMLGGSGLLLAILVCFAFAGATVLLRNVAPPRYAPCMAAFYLVVAVFWMRTFGISLADAVSAALRPLGGLGDSFAALLTIVAVETLLWLVGIHGPAMLAAIVTPVYLTLQSQNAAAYAAGAPLPHLVTTSTFLFVFIGGAGSTFPLVLLMLRSRLRSLRILAAACVWPGFCGINEPLVFGLPLVFEPVFAFPFVAVPLVLSATTYAAFASGLVARPAFYVPSSIPIFVNAFLATADWRACGLVFVNIVVAAAIYLPFLRIYERSREAA